MRLTRCKNWWKINEYPKETQKLNKIGRRKRKSMKILLTIPPTTKNKINKTVQPWARDMSKLLLSHYEAKKDRYNQLRSKNKSVQYHNHWPSTVLRIWKQNTLRTMISAQARDNFLHNARSLMSHNAFFPNNIVY